MASGLAVAKAAKAAGFVGQELVQAIAVAFAESGFNEKATHTNANGSTDYGLWQINSVHGYPELANGQWSDPAANARMAFAVRTAQGWNAWSVRNPTKDPAGFARFTAALPAAQAFALAAGDAGVAALPSTDNTALGLVTEPLAVLHWLQNPDTWHRISKFAVGFIFVAVGAAVLVVNVNWKTGTWAMDKAGAVVGVAGKATRAGKAVK